MKSVVQRECLLLEYPENMATRTQNSYQTFLGDFLKSDIWVICPGCSKRAVVKNGPKLFPPPIGAEIKLICTYCGFSKYLTETPEAILYSSGRQIISGRHYVLGAAIDPYFHLPLWLQAPVNGHILWAYHTEHLQFLRQHTEVRLRERNGQDTFNRSLGSRLPRWMTSKKNRDLVLKKIHDLEQALPHEPKTV